MWTDDWLWGLPLIAVTTLVHATGLGLINRLRRTVLATRLFHARSTFRAVIVAGSVALLATFLHGAEIAIWAMLYIRLGALTNLRDAMLFSIDAMTTYGHANLDLQKHWQMLGALEALNGLLMFGLTTAFLFHLMRDAWPSAGRARQPL